MNSKLRCFVKAHVPVKANELKSEHFLMASAYGTGAAFAHSTLGSAVVALGYLTVAALGVREHRRKVAE